MSLSLTISESNVDKAANTSKITATLKISSSSSWNYDSRSGYITIDGTKYTFSHSFSTGTTTLATKSKTVTHDSDGGGKITVKGYYSTGVSLGNLSTSKTYTLTQIDRTYTIKFNANTTDSVSNMPSSQTKTYGKTLTLSTKVPTRTGYTFKEWNTSSKGTGTSYKPGGSYKTNAADTLYAIWTENSYTITYNLPSGYGTFSNGTTSISVTAKYTEASIVPTVTAATGYTFSGFVVSGTTYQPGATIKSKNAATTLSYVAATSSNFQQVTVTIKFFSSSSLTSEYTSLRQTKQVGSSFTIPTYPGTVAVTQEFKYWESSAGKRVYAGSSYPLSSDYNFYPYITQKAAEKFSYYCPVDIELSSLSYTLLTTESANITSSYSLTATTPTSQSISGNTYVFKYWTTTWNQKFGTSNYAYVIPPDLLAEIEDENNWTNNYNQTYNLYRTGWTLSSVAEGSGKTFYAVYADTTKSAIKYTGYDFAYVKDTLSPATEAGAIAVQTNYANYLLDPTVDTDSDIVLQSNSFVAFAKFTLPSPDITLKFLEITTGNEHDVIAVDEDNYPVITTQFVDLDFYLFLSGTIDPDAHAITTITFSGLQDSELRDIDSFTFTIQPPQVIRDIALDGKVVSFFNQNRDKLSNNSNSELQINGDLRLFGTNIYIGENGDELLSSESDELIRKYEYDSTNHYYGALTGYTGNTIGTLTSSTFDVVSMTWNSDTPLVTSSLMSVGAGPYFTFGTRASNSTNGNYSVAAGEENTASGYYATASGYRNTASGYCATALGYNNTVSVYGATAIGYYNKAQNITGQFVCGRLNATNSSAVFIVGNGTSDSARSNALVVDTSNNLTIAGDMTIGNHTSTVGTIITATPSNSSSATDYATLTSAYLSLPEGTWVITYSCYCDLNSSGKRLAARLYNRTSGTTYTSSRAIGHTSSTAAISVTGSIPIQIAANDTSIALQAYQSSGSSKTISGYMRAVRIA